MSKVTNLKKFNVRTSIDEMQSGVIVHKHPVINAILKLRGVKDSSEFSYSLSKLLPPNTLKGMGEATDLLLKHIKNDSNILIIGDFDADGATATSIGVEGLKLLGAKNVSYLIPHRKTHGYGLSDSIIDLAAESKPDLIVTVDNGITAIDGVNKVHSLEHPCEILITDHHLPAGDELPAAEAIVNPNQPGCPFESKNLAGCGVMFYVIVALRAKMREEGYFIENNLKEPSLDRLLDLVALGTVADVVVLDYNNRILVDAGLKRIRAGLGRDGINEILKVAKRDPEKIVASDFGFAIGPRLNAVGRLDDMTIGVEALLSTGDEAEALAELLNQTNEERKAIQAEMSSNAFDIIKENDSVENFYAIAVYLQDAHEGVMGITAGNGKEATNRPFVCFVDAKDEGQLKGSGRSVPGVHLRHVFDEINAEDPNIFTKYGGHSMAAGLQIYKDKFDDFQRIFDKVTRKYLTEDMIRGDVTSDLELDIEYFDFDLVHAIKDAGPWGSGFEEPTFNGKFLVKSFIVRKDIHLSVVVEDINTGKEIKGIAFGVVEDGEVPVEVGNVVELSFTPTINDFFKGRESVEMMIFKMQDKDKIINSSNTLSKDNSVVNLADGNKPIAKTTLDSFLL